MKTHSFYARPKRDDRQKRINKYAFHTKTDKCSQGLGHQIQGKINNPNLRNLKPGDKQICPKNTKKQTVQIPSL